MGATTKLGLLEAELHRYWSKSQYHGPFNKRWWWSQQGIARAIDLGSLNMPKDEIEAMRVVWASVCVP